MDARANVESQDRDGELMPEISYVYPNLSIFHRDKNSILGGLTERWNQAQKSNCEYIEVPATLIKKQDRKEINITRAQL